MENETLNDHIFIIKESFLNFFRPTWRLISEVIILSVRYLIDTYKLSNPCPTCIVRPCCDENVEFKCRLKRNYLNTLDGYRSPLWKKMFITLYILWFILFCVALNVVIFR
jgi:hypothetical protein